MLKTIAFFKVVVAFSNQATYLLLVLPSPGTKQHHRYDPNLVYFQAIVLSYKAQNEERSGSPVISRSSFVDLLE